jgi:hypothetical protein
MGGGKQERNVTLRTSGNGWGVEVRNVTLRTSIPPPPPQPSPETRIATDAMV